MKSFKDYLSSGEITPPSAYENYQAISTIGLITAHNPWGRKRGNRINFESNGRLLEDIRSLGCPATVVKGMYEGHAEETFVVGNITERDLLRLAHYYEQESVIWGYRRATDEHFFVMFYIENGKVISQGRMDVTLEDVENSEAFFSALKSGTLKIPSFPVRKNAIADLPPTPKPPNEGNPIPTLEA